jgi:hypothetical protein
VIVSPLDDRERVAYDAARAADAAWIRHRLPVRVFDARVPQRVGWRSPQERERCRLGWHRELPIGSRATKRPPSLLDLKRGARTTWPRSTSKVA